MKKFMKKLIKKTEGFTLVELIVVIAILGILAGVAVPAYTGYLDKAKEAGDVLVLDAVGTAAQARCAALGAPTEITVTTSGGAITKVAVSGVTGLGEIQGDSDFLLFLTGSNGSLSSLKLESDTYDAGTFYWSSDWGTTAAS